MANNSIPLRNKLWGGNWWIADSLFPPELKEKLDAGATSFDDNEYWHLDRMYERTLRYKAPMYTFLALFIILFLVGGFLGHFGLIQSFLSLIAIYVIIGAIMHFRHANQVLTPIIEEARESGRIKPAEPKKSNNSKS